MRPAKLKCPDCASTNIIPFVTGEIYWCRKCGTTKRLKPDTSKPQPELTQRRLFTIADGGGEIGG